MRYTVDRIEGNKAVLEGRVNKRMKIVELSELPKNIFEGAILIRKKKQYHLLTEETLKQTKYMQERFKKIQNKKTTQ